MINMLRPTLLVVATTAVGTSLEMATAYADEPSVTPYRPTISNPATLSEPGWLELEAGLLLAHGGDMQRSTSLPYLLKYAVSADFGVLVGGNAYIRQTDWESKRTSGNGDTAIFLKHHWALGSDDGPALGLEYGVNLPTAQTGLSSGKTDYTINGIYSTTLEENPIDLNLNLTRIGTLGPGQGRIQLGYAVTISRAISEKWGMAAEISGDARHGVAPSDQLLFAASYAFSKRIVWDAGMAFGLSKVSPDWSLFSGVSLLLGKVR